VKDGITAWYLNGNRHREGGPAFERADGYKEWWVNGELHREDGPAVEYARGSKEWYLRGVKQEPPVENFLVLNGKKYKLTEF